MDFKLTALVALLASSCQGIFDGQIGGHQLTVKEAIAIRNACIGTNCGWVITLSEQTGMCAALNERRNFKNEKTLDLVVSSDSFIDDGDEFSVPGNAYASFSVLNSECKATDLDPVRRARSGVITIMRSLSSSDDAADGIFDLTFEDGEAKGSFHAAICEVDWESRPAVPSCR